MGESETGTDPAGGRAQPGERLDSWKKIASYLKRDVSTVQRWERREGMPVHRHLHDKQGSVFAYRSELDSWWQGRCLRLQSEEPSDAAATRVDAPAVPRSPLPAAAQPSRAHWGVFGVLLIASAAALVWWLERSDFFWRNPLANAQFSRMPELGAEHAATISRDGRYVAVLGNRDGPLDLWLSEVDRADYRNLTQGALRQLDVLNPELRTLNFSADASLLTVWTRQSDGAAAGRVSILAVPTAGGALQPYLPEAAEFDWSHRGQRLVYHTTAPGDPLYIREGSTGSAAGDRRIYVASPGEHCHFPLWSPDDDYVYFIRGVPTQGWDLWRIRTDGAGLERITRQNAHIAYPVMLDQRTLLYVASDASGDGPWLYGVDVERRVPHRLSAGLESYTSLAASADGRRLVATVANPRTSLWQLDLAAGTNAQTAPRQLMQAGSRPRLSASSVFYVATRAGRQGIWQLTEGQEHAVWSTEGGRILGGPAVSADGQRVAFTLARGSKTLLYVARADGTRSQLVSERLILRGDPAFTPDGGAIVAAAMQGGEPRLTRISLSGDAPQELLTEYSLNPVWSPDGRFLVYAGADIGTSFPVRAATADGRPYPLPNLLLARGSAVAFANDPQTLLIMQREPGHLLLIGVDLRTGTQRLLHEMPADFAVSSFAASPDGRAIVFDRVEENADVALIRRNL